MSVETLNDKVFVVTGGTSGIGEGAAMAFAKAGAAGVVFCGRNEERGAGVTDRSFCHLHLYSIRRLLSCGIHNSMCRT